MNESKFDTYQDKRILITGATGFVGGAIARKMAQMGATVHALHRPTSSRTALADVPITWHEGDILQPDSLRGLFTDIDLVVHAAGMLGQAGVPEARYHALHAEGTHNVLTAVRDECPTARVLYISSPGVLGPITGTTPADESTPLAPSNPYERSKAKAEAVAQEFVEAGLDVVMARPEFMYGPGDLHVLGLFQAVQKGIFFYIDRGNYVCHPTYIDDGMTGMLLCLQKGRTGECYHITGERPVSFRELGDGIAHALTVRRPWIHIPRIVAMVGATALEWVGKLIGITPPLSRTGVAFFSENRRFSWEKANRELGYTPKHDLTAGIQKTVAWYRENGHLA